MPPIDLIVSGTVAVNAAGTRIGKGAGYADLENALLYENGLILRETIIATTVHELQVVSEQLPETAHDFSVDLIVTPERRIQCGPARRRTGLLWEQLGASKIGTIPFLAEHPKHTVLGG
jgi:5-formyltetrahydrofolate cyclo-ligase